MDQVEFRLMQRRAQIARIADERRRKGAALDGAMLVAAVSFLALAVAFDMPGLGVLTFGLSLLAAYHWTIRA